MKSFIIRNQAGLSMFLMGLVIGVCFSIASSMSYQDEVLERDNYCERVKEGSWKDFKGIYDEECLKDD